MTADGVRALLRQPEVTHVACAFDTVIESFRNDLFEGYKDGSGVDEALLAKYLEGGKIDAASVSKALPVIRITRRCGS